MLSLVIDLFINLCVLISLIFIYMQFRVKLRLEKKSPIQAILTDGLAGGILGTLLMYFSIQVTPETIVDLRYVPVMLLIIFLGVPQAVISAALIVGGRFIFGINSSSLAAMILMIILIVGFILIHWFLKRKEDSPPPYKQGITMVIFSNIVFSVIITLLLQDGELLKSLIPSYWVISLFGGCTAIFVTEYIRKTQYLLMKYEAESTTDFLTGLNNVRQFDAIWNTLSTNAIQKKEKLSLLIIDIDHFKQVNDTYGHSVGDKVLKELGKILKDVSRSFDIVSRNGGEEFSVILPDCPHDQALQLAERIRAAVASHPFPVSATKTINLTISIGVATYPEKISDATQMFGVADDYLYKAKRTGRNKVCAS